MSEDNPILLIVDDDVQIAEMLGDCFAIEGYQVQKAHWGREAIKIIQTDVPDLVILDIHLPDIDGFEVARWIRANRRTKLLPILFLTERSERESRLQGLAFEAEDYITKPFDMEELFLRVRNALRRNLKGSLTNPVTQLPEGSLIDERLRECLGQTDWGILLITVTHLNALERAQGILARNACLQSITRNLRDVRLVSAHPRDFIGQWKDNQFILVITAKALPAVLKQLKTNMQNIVAYYNAVEVQKNFPLVVKFSSFDGAESTYTDLETLRGDIIAAYKGDL